MYEVSVACSFLASHQVALPNGAMESIHEHEWLVEAVWCGRRLDERGLLVDFVEAERALQALSRELGGAHLNDHPMLAGRAPSAENLARVLFERLEGVRGAVDGRLLRVRVREAPGCHAVYARDCADTGGAVRPGVHS